MNEIKCVKCGEIVEAVKFRGRISEKNRSTINLRLFDGSIARIDFTAHFCRQCSTAICVRGLEAAAASLVP